MHHVTGAMAFTKSVSSSSESNRFLIVHRHAGKSLSNVSTRGNRIRFSVRTLRININQAHLHCGERILKLTISGIALVTKPFGLSPPVDILFRFPDILTTAGEAKGLQSH